MSFYLWIVAEQRPFPFDLDEKGRTMFSFNITAQARGQVAKWADEIVKILVGAGVGTYGTMSDTIFIGPAAHIPDGDGPYISVIDTSAQAPDETHNNDFYDNLGAQIIVRALDSEVGETKALEARSALTPKRSYTVTL